MTLLPDEMVALPLYTTFEMVQGNQLSLTMDAFGTLKNIMTMP